MAKKLRAYDPAEDLISEQGIAFFMEEAFKTGIPPLWPTPSASSLVRKALRNSRNKLDCRGSSFIGRSARMGILPSPLHLP